MVPAHRFALGALWQSMTGASNTMPMAACMIGAAALNNTDQRRRSRWPVTAPYKAPLGDVGLRWLHAGVTVALPLASPCSSGPVDAARFIRRT